ncbi:MAG TPA: phosphate ABC transporter substrate-binding protein PstS [Tahibacter sp.]|uniref:phosphate ABC transporter substrate-binding protein PstS n=1 Tax=Tahibacter sp. TaxID=2056211 RepID=UPI002CC7D663|nr:phosphate ABC transporter substrate-binding protein PstS [Tahibacter sp.]HSX62774.1 phosphate ABC transporter substrate-binding protein PstS [Tahibacter sp.]
MITRFIGQGLAGLLMLAGGIAANAAAAATVAGAGSTFVEPVLTRWATQWAQQQGDTIRYDGVGSGAGIEQLKAGKVDFAATDAPLKDEELRAGGFRQFPIVAGGIVPVTNLRGAGRKRLRLDGPLLARIFQGKIVRWNDPALQAVNPTFAMPDAPITVVRRSDSSGITYNFTAYLSKTSPEWAGTIGTGKTVKWPVGIAAEGNTGLGQRVVETPYSIGYVEYGYALQHELQIVNLYATPERAISPTQTTIRNALESADWLGASHFNLLLVGIQGSDTWPIAASTWIVMPRSLRGAERERIAMTFFGWALERGGETADSLGYTPLPPGLVGLVKESWKR